MPVLEFLRQYTLREYTAVLVVALIGAAGVVFMLNAASGGTASSTGDILLKRQTAARTAPASVRSAEAEQAAAAAARAKRARLLAERRRIREQRAQRAARRAALLAEARARNAAAPPDGGAQHAAARRDGSHPGREPHAEPRSTAEARRGPGTEADPQEVRNDRRRGRQLRRLRLTHPENRRAIGYGERPPSPQAGMDSERVALMDSFYDAFRRRDVRALLELCHDDVEVYKAPGVVDMVAALTPRGRDRVEGYLEGWLESWDAYEPTLQELRTSGDQVVALVQVHSRGRGSQFDLERGDGRRLHAARQQDRQHAPVREPRRGAQSTCRVTGQASAAAAARFQAFLLAALDGVDRPLDAAVRGAVSMYDFAQDHPADARLLAELDELNRPVEEQLTALSRRLFGNSGPTALERTTFAVVDIPHGAVRRHLLAGTTPPPALRAWIEAAVRSTLKDPAS